MPTYMIQAFKRTGGFNDVLQEGDPIVWNPVAKTIVFKIGGEPKEADVTETGAPRFFTFKSEDGMIEEAFLTADDGKELVGKIIRHGGGFEDDMGIFSAKQEGVYSDSEPS